MRFIAQAALIGLALMQNGAAQDTQRSALTQGVSVQMPVATHPVEMRAADEPGATVVVIAADGKMFLGGKAIETATLAQLGEAPVYVKADARAPYQQVLAAMDALRAKTVNLLTAAPANAGKQARVAPYGIAVTVAR